MTLPPAVASLAAEFDALTDALILAIADTVLVDWREHLPEVDRARLARVLLVIYASSSWSARVEIEQTARQVVAA
jgi:hypothetical protein